MFFVEEQIWSIRVVFLLDPSILLERKVLKGEASICKIKYRATEKLDMGKPSAFFLRFEFGGQSDKKWNGKRKCKVFFKEEGTI